MSRAELGKVAVLVCSDDTVVEREVDAGIPVAQGTGVSWLSREDSLWGYGSLLLVRYESVAQRRSFAYEGPRLPRGCTGGNAHLSGSTRKGFHSGAAFAQSDVSSSKGLTAARSGLRTGKPVFCVMDLALPCGQGDRGRGMLPHAVRCPHAHEIQTMKEGFRNGLK